MATKITLKDATRGIVLQILALQDDDAPKKWSQKEHDAGVAYATAGLVTAVQLENERRAKLPDAVVAGLKTTDGKDAIPAAMTEREIAKLFLTTYACHGFPSNASQFSQALDKLEPSDDCYVKRSAIANEYV